MIYQPGRWVDKQSYPLGLIGNMSENSTDAIRRHIPWTGLITHDSERASAKLFGDLRIFRSRYPTDFGPDFRQG